MTTSPAQILQALLANPVDLANVRSMATPDVTYVSLSEDNPELKRFMKWTGTHNGPEALVEVFQGVGQAWETKAFTVREVLEQDDKVVMFGSFTRESGQQITSLFSLFAKVKDGRVHYMQFMEDTFGTSGTVGRPRS